MKNKLKELICKKIKKQNKAQKSIYQNVLGIIYDLNFDEKLILEWIQAAENDKIFKSLNFINNGNWIDSLYDKKYIPFMKELFECRPVGLGTPNAACGEGELMLILSSNQITKPKKNDIKIKNKTFNLKNTNPRIFANTEGTRLNKIMLKKCEELGLIPNDREGKKSVQLINYNFIINHWNPQFLKLKENDLEEFLKVFLINLFPDKIFSENYLKKIIKNALNNNSIIWEIWIKELIVFIYENGEDKKDNLVLMSVNGKVSILPTDLEEFKKMVEQGKLIFESEYFRMHQNNKVGVYIKFVN